MIDILKIIVSVIGFASVSGGSQTANMVRFDAVADSPYFQGCTLPGGVDTQLASDSLFTLSARYILEGIDFKGDSCKIFIENNGVGSQPFTSPRIITDSRALSSLNNADLAGSISNENGALTITIGKKMTQVPPKVFSLAPNRGTLEEVEYKVKRDGSKFTKRAMVYLPYGYDASDPDTKYDVVYLIHGGGDNAESFFADSRSPLPLTNVLDHLIADGVMKPVIVVCPTFYDNDRNIGANRMDDAVAATRNFNSELRKYLVPTIETHYNTHFSPKEKDAVTASRAHRAFGGFSMGALCTWYQLAYDSAAVGTYLPLSGDLWVYDSEGNKQTPQQAAHWLVDRLNTQDFGKDFRVLAYTGSDDIAYKPEKSLVEALYSTSGSLFNPDNMEFGVKPGGVHYYGDINEYLYHALPMVFSTEE